MHALLGENGAGKSTLMNVLYGLTSPDEGEIIVNGAPVDIASPLDAIALGIGMVHQHFMLVPVMTVAENIVLAVEPHQAGAAGPGRGRGAGRDISDRYGLAVDPDALVEDITVGMQQRVEILKALYRGADILILDEPTAVLTPQEATSWWRSCAASPPRARRSSSSPTSSTRCSTSPTGSPSCGGEVHRRPSPRRARPRRASPSSWSAATSC